MESVYFTLSFIIIIFIDATGDAFSFMGWYQSKVLNNNKYKKWFGWFSQDLIILYALVVYPLLIEHYDITRLQVFGYFASYVFMRAAIFNIIWNAWVPHVEWWYFGKEKWWDKILNWITYTGWFAKKFKPTAQAVVVRMGITFFCISLAFSGVWLLFPQ